MLFDSQAVKDVCGFMHMSCSVSQTASSMLQPHVLTVLLVATGTAQHAGHWRRRLSSLEPHHPPRERYLPHPSAQAVVQPDAALGGSDQRTVCCHGTGSTPKCVLGSAQV